MSNDPSSDFETEKIYIDNERVFVDRETCIKVFKDNIQNLETRGYNVLFYHGIAGIGKSKLQKGLQKILDNEYPEILWAAIDLNTKTYREVGTFLIVLRNEIQRKCNAKFYLFNTVHAIYWKKLHPEVPLPKENYPLIKEGGFFSKIIDVLDQFGPARLTWDIINNAPDSVISFFKAKIINLNKLTAMEAHELEETLPIFFAADFTWYLGTTNSKAYIFIDTYEALWDGLRDKGSFYEKDEWIRENLIPNMPGVSWVICGREKLLLDKHNKGCEIFLESHPLDELPERYCQIFLEDCGIECKEIRDKIIKASEGVPHYLNLSMDTFEKICETREPISEDFGKTQHEIFKMFVRYLDRNEIRALEVLSVPNFWDRDLFKILMKEFDTGFPVGAFSELVNFSFIKADSNKRYSIHQLMRKSLQEYQDQDDRKDVHKFMFEYYNNKLKDIDIKAITPEYQTALIEAFYHAKMVLETEDLFDWFIATSDPFSRAAFWQLIAPRYEEMLQILKAKFGCEHPDIAKMLDHLAEQYYRIGEYEKALSHYLKALEIGENVLDPEDFATIQNNLAEFYRQMGDYGKALPLCQKVLEIDENMGDQKNIANSLNNFALLYDQKGDYKESLSLYQRAFKIGENYLDQKDFATILNNFALLYHHIGEYNKALPLYQRALKMYENVLNPEHPSIATVLNNIALLYDQIGEFDKALLLYNRALAIREKLRPGHPVVATTLNNLAGLYGSIGNYEKALPLYRKTLKIYIRKMGRQHPYVATVMNDLAGLYFYMGKYEKVLPIYRKALKTYEKSLGIEHPHVATTLNNIALFYCCMEEYEKALPLYQRALAIRESVLGPQHLDIAGSLNNLAGLYKDMGDYVKARPLYERSLEIVEKILGSDHPDTIIVKNNFTQFISDMEGKEEH